MLKQLRISELVQLFVYGLDKRTVAISRIDAIQYTELSVVRVLI